jgi:dTDP-4-amino-4,6-dideoxygalactose transaminase
MQQIDYENLQLVNKKFEKAYKQAFSGFLDSGWYILGKQVAAFEQAFAKFLGVKHCIGLASGLDALQLALRALDLPRGCEVLVPSNTYIATILAILNEGLVPVLVEPNKRTYNINPKEIARKITPNTRAVMVVHLYGKVCEMDAIMQLAEQHKLHVVEDCAQSHGATLRGKQSGTFGAFGAFSFYPTKNLGALGDAGALVTNDDALAEKVRTLRNYGSKIKYYNDLIGLNSRLDEVQASFLTIKLQSLDKINQHKRRLGALYQKGISNAFIKPVISAGYHDVYHIYSIRHPERDRLRAYLLENGIKTEIHYPVAPNLQKGYAHLFEGQTYPISDEIHKTTLSLPISFFHKKTDVKRVIEVLNAFK